MESVLDDLRFVDVYWNNVKVIIVLDEKIIGYYEWCNILVYYLNEIVFVVVDEKDGDLGFCL